MISNEYYATRKDRVRIFKKFDAIVREDGTVVPSGLKIRKVGTEELYDVAFDVEGATFEYEQTDLPIDENMEEVKGSE